MTEALDTIWPIQVELYARLTGDETLAGLVATQAGARPLKGIYDVRTPEGAPYPYVTIGEPVETPRNTIAEFGAETVVTLHIWVKERSSKTGLAIANRLRALLDHQPMTLTGLHVVSVKHEQTQVLPDPNPEIRHLTVRIRITTEQE